MTLDIRTLVFVLSLVSLFHTLAIYLLYLMNRRYEGLGWWALGGVFMTFAFPCLFLRVLPVVGPVAIVLGNVLFISAMGVIHIGAQRFFGQRQSVWRLVFFCTLVCLIAAYFTFIDNNMKARLLNFSLGMGLLSLAAGRLFFVLRTPELTIPSRLLGAAFVAYGLAYFFRGALVALYLPISNFFEPSLANAVSYIAPLLLGMLWYFGFIFLVHQRVLNEQRRATDNLELIFNASPDAVLISHLNDGHCVAVNDGFVALTGYSREEAIGDSLLNLDIWSQPAQRDKLLKQLLEQGGVENEEIEFRCKSGELRTGMVSAKTFQYQDSPHILSVTRDITERKRMEEALRVSEEKWRTLVNTSPDGVCIASLDLVVRQVNNKGVSMFGYESLEQIVGRSLFEFLHPDTRDKAKHFYEELLRGNNIGPVEYLVLRRDGSSFFIEVNAEFLLDSEGRATEIFFIERDLTERKRAEELREEIERILRHDLRSPAGSAVSMAKLLAQAPELSPAYRELAQVLQQEGQQMLDTLNFSLDLYKIETGKYRYEPQPTDALLLVRQVSNALLLVRQHARKRIEITLDGRDVASGDNCYIQASPFLLRSALQNLIQNALESAPSSAPVRVSLSRSAGASIEIRNTGAIPQEIRARFFEKYLTSGKAKGTGLGAYSAKKAIEAQCGAIEMRTSDVENETVITVRMPC